MRTAFSGFSLFISCLLSISLYSCRSYKLVPGLELSSLSFAPVFILPECDSSNGIEKVYFHRQMKGGTELIEVTVVFGDEDQPCFLFNGIYDLFRQFKYHRKKDIETFFIQSEKEGRGITCIDFGDAYSAGQKFKKGIVKHYHQVVAGAQLQMEGQRPLIFINTWNHLFSEKDNNPLRSKIRYRTYECLSGTREDAEPKKKR